MRQFSPKILQSLDIDFNMNEESRRGRRTSEQEDLDNPELLSAWKEEVSEIKRKSSSNELNDLIDAMKTSSLRAKLGRDRNREYPSEDFRHWTRRWSNLKSMALIKTLLLRQKGDQRILVAYEVDDTQEEIYKERLKFVFLMGISPYRTSTALSNLTRLVSREAIMQALGESDALPDPPEPRRFYTG